MAKGGNSQRSNSSRFSKPYDVSNSFVTKVASRVSDYLGGWFGSSLKSSRNVEPTDTSVLASNDRTQRRIFETIEVKRPSMLPNRFLNVDNVDTPSSPAKRLKLSQAEKVDIDFPISPIPSTSGLFSSSTSINHTYEIPKREDFMSNNPGPSTLQSQRYSQSNNVAPPTSSTTTDVKANGTTDNHSDSSESTSGCSSLVPQSTYACSSRKRNLEEKLKYARQLQQSRATMFLNRSVPVGDTLGGPKKPSFDVTAYANTSLDKSLLREKLVNSPFYTGQTSYGGASAYRLSRNTLYSQRYPKTTLEKREGMQVEVKPSHHGSTEYLTNMSHTAKKILEALEQFSTPVSDAKRIPVNRLTPLGTKRRRFDEFSEAKLQLSTPISPLNPNPNPGPVITGLNVPTVPDLLKLKRLERIQNSTAAARQVAVEKQEYTLPSDVTPAKRTGKIVTKRKDKDKNLVFEKLEDVNLPKIPLPITTLPKFDFKLPPSTPTIESKIEPLKKDIDRTFKFSDPILVSSTYSMPERSVQKSNFTFSDPLYATGKKNEVEKEVSTSLTNFMSSDAVAKLKRKSINDVSFKTSSPVMPSVSKELKTGSVMDFFNKTVTDKKVEQNSLSKSVSGTWECDNCLIRNLNGSKICTGCKVSKTNKEKDSLPSPPKEKPVVEEPKTIKPLGFKDKFKPPPGSWSCKECFVNNKESALKCIACQNPKPLVNASKEVPPKDTPKLPPSTVGFGDLFKKPANQWECPVCMIRNKETDAKCAACETPKPGTKPEKTETKFNFGVAPSTGGFVFGIDKASGVKSAADSSTFKIPSTSQSEPVSTASTTFFKPISTSVGVFTFGIPPSASQEKKEPPKIDTNTTAETSNSRFMVTSTSGSSLRKDESVVEIVSDKVDQDKEKRVEAQNDKNEVSVTDFSKTENEVVKPFTFNSSNKPSSNSPFGMPKEENKDKIIESNKKPSTFFFGGNSNSLETVSSSTTDFVFGKSKSNPQPVSGLDSSLSKTSPPLMFKPFGGTESSPKPFSSMPLDANEAEVKPSSVSTSNAVTTSYSIFGSRSLFNNSSPKISFGTSSTSSSGFLTSLTSSTPASFSMPAQSFSNTGFNSQPLNQAGTSTATSITTPVSSIPGPTFGVIPQSSENHAIEGTPTFGNSTQSNAFGSTFGSQSNQEAPKLFGTMEHSSGNSIFGSNPTPFGSPFMQVTAEKPVQPFIFGGASVPTTTTTSDAPVVTAPEVFTFGSSKPPQFNFGSGSNFNFGSNLSTTSTFGGFDQTKAEATSGSAPTLFGNATSIFGQSSAPAAFKSSAPKFEFGSPALQQHPPTEPNVFQFGDPSTQSQPASAPPGTSFNLSVPQKFNFTGGQTPTFSAQPTPSADEKPARKVIKAIRRTNPKRTN